MKTLLVLIFAGLCFALSGCGTQARYSSYAAPRSENPEIIKTSLFDSKDRTISEEDIQRILRGRIILPDTLRIALFKYSGASINRYYTNWWTDEEYLKTQQRFVDTLVYQVHKANRVSKIIHVPALMTGSSPSMTQLRETAVRLQADVLIVYSLSSDIYYKYKVFSKSEAKAFATCETIVMDTRTGVIPHTAVTTREMLVKKDQPDLTDEETRKKAERQAVILTLTDTGISINTFLNHR